MNKEKIALIGFGRWGKKIYNSIKNDFNIKYVLNSKDNISKIKSVNWVIVATPDKSHYKIVKYLLNRKSIQKQLTYTVNLGWTERIIGVFFWPICLGIFLYNFFKNLLK